MSAPRSIPTEIGLKMDTFDKTNLAMALMGEAAIIAAGAGTGISAKFIEKGGSDLIIIYNSGRFRMMGHGSTCGMMAYGDANAIAMEIGEYEVLPVVEECPVICGVHATDPRRRMWHWLGQVKDMGRRGQLKPDGFAMDWTTIDGKYETLDHDADGAAQKMEHQGKVHWRLGVLRAVLVSAATVAHAQSARQIERECRSATEIAEIVAIYMACEPNGRAERFPAITLPSATL